MAKAKQIELRKNQQERFKRAKMALQHDLNGLDLNDSKTVELLEEHYFVEGSSDE
ncbi:hypothetical protein [Haladaptatus sp. R4]|uniref:hypothetical protein n=1 Tax=Haladaptatus sp. R4 TaxID=1679489 RepID=UPI001681B2B3|nr:hypothetical protein [Haladaptatus sp. R4]